MISYEQRYINFKYHNFRLCTNKYYEDLRNMFAKKRLKFKWRKMNISERTLIKYAEMIGVRYFRTNRPPVARFVTLLFKSVPSEG